MIKARLTNGNVILGITNQNIKMLKQGKPMKIDMKELHLGDKTIYIMYGKDEKAITDELGFDVDYKTQGNA